MAGMKALATELGIDYEIREIPGHAPRDILLRPDLPPPNRPTNRIRYPRPNVLGLTGGRALAFLSTVQGDEGYHVHMTRPAQCALCPKRAGADGYCAEHDDVPAHVCWVDDSTCRDCGARV